MAERYTAVLSQRPNLAQHRRHWVGPNEILANRLCLRFLFLSGVSSQRTTCLCIAPPRLLVLRTWADCWDRMLEIIDEVGEILSGGGCDFVGWGRVVVLKYWGMYRTWIIIDSGLSFSRLIDKPRCRSVMWVAAAQLKWNQVTVIWNSQQIFLFN